MRAGQDRHIRRKTSCVNRDNCEAALFSYGKENGWGVIQMIECEIAAAKRPRERKSCKASLMTSGL